MSWWIYPILFAAGLGAGIMNTVAGGGSVLTLPALIFAGIPAGIANATNRIGVLAQNVTAIWQFRRGGFAEGPLTWRLTAAGLAGAGIGALLAARIPDEKFEVVLGLVMLGLLPLILIKPKRRGGARNGDGSMKRDEWYPLTPARRYASLASFFLLGIYGGFLQAGIGIMILLTLERVAHLNLVIANYVKLVFVLLVTFVALMVFIAQGVAIAWWAGLVITAGQMLGGYIGSWVAIRKGEMWIRAFMILSILLSSAKLLGLFDLFS